VYQALVNGEKRQLKPIAHIELPEDSWRAVLKAEHRINPDLTGAHNNPGQPCNNREASGKPWSSTSMHCGLSPTTAPPKRTLPEL
jgi:hypothetical protein